MDYVVFRWIWVSCLNTVKKEFLEVETCKMVYVKVVLVVLRCVCLVLGKFVSKHLEEVIAEESRCMLNGWHMLGCVTGCLAGRAVWLAGGTSGLFG